MTVPISGDPTISGVVLTEQPTTPASPASGKRKLFVDTAGALKVVNSAGAVSSVAGATLDAVGDVNAPAPTDGQVLTWQATPGAWVAATPAGGMTNPMTAQDDLVVGGASGAPTRLAKGTDGQVLTVDPTSHHLVWATPAAGGGGGYATVRDEGTALTARTVLDVVGRGVLADDSGGVTRLRVEDPVTMVHLVDDFLCGSNTGTAIIGDLGWTLSGAGGATVLLTAEAGHPGIFRNGVGATSGSVAALGLRNAAAAADFLNAETWEIRALVRLNNTDANTICRLGIGTNVASTPTDGVYAEKDAADTSWFGTCRSGGVQSRTAALVACGTGWVAFAVRRVNGTTMGFRTATTLGGLDAATEVTLNTNVTASTSVVPFFQVANNTTAAKSADIDLFDLLITGLSR